MSGKVRFGGKGKGKGGKGRRSVLGTGILLAVAGVMLLVQGTTDYTDHTERAEATVVERDVDITYDDDGDRTGEDVTVYVDYRAEGADHRRVDLEGLGSDSFHEGDTLTVAYAPGEPGHVVTTQSTDEDAYAFAFYLGLPIVAAGLGVTALGVVLRLRKSGRVKAA
ncbi:DUF3592 domain-containing protein [Streptomonospora sp. PA3]|uniref:DUF3592 domain-containing protein n=1 Tax=Streptomonospora sp. PA3 TaxID=2607326 RepID=UPI0012DED8DC|nr:DUF3592 domain-containing protein [Streptomonospora sp. PA3]